MSDATLDVQMFSFGSVLASFSVCEQQKVVPPWAPSRDCLSAPAFSMCIVSGSVI